MAAEPSITIGTANEDTQASLYRVRGVVRLADGRIAVANSGSGEIRFFRANGTYQSAVGRPGAGPGEFDTISRMWQVGDSLFVYDFQQGNRISVFASGGRYSRSFNLVPTTDGRAPLDAEGFPDGRVLATVSGDRARPPEGLSIGRNLYVIYSANGDPEESVGLLPGTEVYYHTLPNGSVAGLERPFGVAPQRALGAEGLYFGTSESYEIASYDVRGKLRRLIRRNVGKAPISTEEKAAWEEERDHDLASSSPAFRELLVRAELPVTVPAYGPLHVDASQNLWVAEYRRRPETIRKWDVFDRLGRWLGVVEAPAGLVIHDIGESYVLGVRRDDLDVEYVQLHYLAKPSGQ